MQHCFVCAYFVAIIFYVHLCVSSTVSVSRDVVTVRRLLNDGVDSYMCLQSMSLALKSSSVQSDCCTQCIADIS